MQNHYNLVYCEEEREMLPLCGKEDVGVIPWSPLAQGYLTRPHEEMTAMERGEELTDRHQEYRSGGGPDVNERVEELAAERGVKIHHCPNGDTPLKNGKEGERLVSLKPKISQIVHDYIEHQSVWLSIQPQNK